MARSSRTGGKTNAAKTPKASSAKGRNPKTRSQKGLSSSKKTSRKPSITDLQKQLEHQAQELREARQQQAASSRVLHIIGASPGTLLPVFQAIVKDAVELCGARFGAVFKMEGDLLHLLADYNLGAAHRQLFETMYPMTPNRGHISGRAILKRSIVQIPDVNADEDYRGAQAKQSGFRSLLATPLLKGDKAIGSIVIYKAEPGTFTARQMALLQNFAAQAVIAIENARLFDEVQTKTRDLEEALVHQTGSANILKVIATSPNDIAPVLQAIVEGACEFCNAADAAVMLKEGDQLRFRAHHGSIPVTADFRQISRNWVSGRAVIDKIPIHVHDFLSADGDEFPEGRDMAARRGIRAILTMPLLRNDEAIGAIALRRLEPIAFTEKQISLLRTFADQAVIAIGNVRLFDEVQARTRDLQESLQQQTATSEVLQIISASPGDLAPVFEKMLENATRVCGAEFGSMVLVEGDTRRNVAIFNGPPAFVEARAGVVGHIHPRSSVAAAIRTRQVVQVEDVRNMPAYLERDPPAVQLAELGGARTIVVVPMLREDDVIGLITVYRQEVRLFSDKQIDLLTNFARQAVIAIENARLLAELRLRTDDLTEALVYQTGSSNILKVIASSPTDVGPALKAIVESACEICDAYDAVVFLKEGGDLVFSAHHGPIPIQVDRLPINRQWVTARAVVDKVTQHVHDLFGPEGEEFPVGRAQATAQQYRTVLSVPLLQESEAIGVISLRRVEVQPFNDKQIGLLKSFADQAVIAISNVRLFEQVQARTHDLQESLQQQTATADVLKVISRSAFDLQTVLQTLVESATKLCNASMANIRMRDGDVLRAQAFVAVSEEQRDFILRHPVERGRGTVVGRAFLSGELVHVSDVLAEPEYEAVESIRMMGHRAVLAVPMIMEGRVEGVFSLVRTKPEPYSDREIQLVRTFVDQALIAIENARLFNEVQSKTFDLEESLQQQTATGDVLKIISRSSVDLETVLDTLVETVARLCRADQTAMLRRRDNMYHLVAAHGLSAEVEEFQRGHPFAANRSTLSGRVALERRVVQIPDVLQDTEYGYSETQKITGYRTLLGVPLLREESLIGIFIITRTRADPFTDKEIELATTFADQAVIAIENARLFEELRERQAELRVTFDNMGDGVAMFGADRQLAAWNRNFQEMLDLPDALLIDRPSFAELFRYLATRGEFGSADLEEELSRSIEDTSREMRYERVRPDGRVVEVRRNPVPDGGFVMIYADITERKRAEEAIRLARDAAENALRDLQTAQDRLIQTEKLASLGQLTAGIAHEIKNPLNFVNNFSGVSVELIDELLETLERVTTDMKTHEEIVELANTLRDNLDKIVQHGKRADSIVKNMLLHSREGRGERRTVDINALVEESLNLAYHGARAEGRDFKISLERDFDPAVGVADVYPQEITRVLLNLISNGFYAATRRAGTAGNGFEPRLKAITRNLGDRVEIRIRDNGTGIPPEVKDKMFNPFFTTKPAGEGTGLGLSMSHDIVVKQHGGTIDVETEPGAFTEFIVTLPRATGARNL